MKIACRVSKNYKVEYFNHVTGKTLYWEALKDTCAYGIPSDFKQYPLHGSGIKAGQRIPYDHMKYGYKERDFKLIEA